MVSIQKGIARVMHGDVVFTDEDLNAIREALRKLFYPSYLKKAPDPAV
jgi:hypothetical protein